MHGEGVETHAHQPFDIRWVVRRITALGLEFLACGNDRGHTRIEPSLVAHALAFVIGGRETDVPTSLNVNQKYDPKKDRWTELAPMPTKRSGAASTSIDENIYVLGGEKVVGSFNTVEKYNPKSDRWAEEKPMPTARLGLDAVTLDGKIYAIGGKLNQTKESATNINEIFIPK